MTVRWFRHWIFSSRIGFVHGPRKSATASGRSLTSKNLTRFTKKTGFSTVSRIGSCQAINSVAMVDAAMVAVAHSLLLLLPLHETTVRSRTRFYLNGAVATGFG